MEDTIDIRDELLDLDVLESSQYMDFKKYSNSKMLQFFIDMDSTFEFVEFERWLIDE